MLKSELRSKYKPLRKSMSLSDLESGSLNISNALLKLPIWNHNFYHLFLSIVKHREINTEYILNILSGKDKNIVISKSNFESQSLSNYLLTDNTLIKENSWGIPEPVDGISINVEQLDIVFVPLLAYDKKGNRVGYGKGLYDKFLTNCTTETIKIGLSLFDPEEEISDIHSGDIKLNYCVTPREIHQF